MTFVIDPRRGDAEDDASSTKQRSMLSLAGSLLAEISLPKLIIAWVLLVGAPALLIGIAPLALSISISTASSKAAYALSGIGSLLLFAAVLAASWFGLRRLLRMVEESFWSLNSLAVQPTYVLTRELLRHVAEKLLPAKASARRRETLRARMAAVAGLAIFIPVAIVVALVWPATRWVGTWADLAPMRQLITVAVANSFVVMAGYFAVAALAWGVADAVMSPLRNRRPAPEDPVRTWRIAHLSDLHTVGERYGFRLESGRAGARGNERLHRLFARLDEIHAAEPLDAVLVTGDITDAGRSAEWAEFFAALAPFPRLADNLLILPGNHDINVVDRANPARLDMPFSPNKRLREARIISAMAALQGSRVHLVDLARKALGPTLDETLATYRAAVTAFADKGSLRLSRAVADLWTRLFPLVRPPQTKDGLGIILLNSNADTHFSFTNALGLVSADEMRGVDIACSLFPSARWLVALHHHTSEYPRPVKHLSERIGTALINGTWFLRRLQRIAPGAVVMHGHRHVDWIGECGSLRIVSAPSPVMNTTDDRTTYFYIHTLARTPKHPLLDLLPPQRIDIPGSPLQDIDETPIALREA
ncbi:MAG: metallophosphoesterase [Xanthobacteraceae bacterium]